MFWVDELVAQIEAAYPGKKKFIVRDEKTASGRVHVGSLRGVVIHGVVAQALAEKGYDVEYFYEINDADPMDGMPVYLDKKVFDQHMGKPLKDVPTPDEKTAPGLGIKPAENFARYFGNEFVDVINSIGFKPTIYLGSDYYAEGKYDHWIDVALENPDEIRRIYKEVSGSEKDEEWNPVQVVCENCGRVGTTTVIGSEGPMGAKIVEYRCEPNKVKWAVGCGHTGKVAPYKGRGKLPWKVEWAAKWQIFPVDIEGAGKDHSVVGGSRDVAARIAKEVFKGVVPFNIPYEFLNFGGAKMSASKGIGASSREVADSITPELLRFLMVRTRYPQAIDFDTGSDAIPRLFDAHDEAAAAYFGHSDKENAEDLKRVYHFSQLDSSEIGEVFFPRFSRVAFTVQIPSLDFKTEMEKLKGAPLTPADITEAELRRDYARVWLQRYAPDSAKFTVQKELPPLARELSEDQKHFLKAVADLMLSRTEWLGEELHTSIHEVRKSSPLEARDAFKAIYIALLGKDSGPQAGWFLDALDREFVTQRFYEIAKLPKFEKPEIADLVSPEIVIKKEVRVRFPGVKVGFALLRGVHIGNLGDNFESIAAPYWQGLDFENLKKKSPRLESFREMYRGFGVKPSNNKPSPVALISRLANGKKLTPINSAVDMGNIISVKHQLAVGLFDLDKMTLPIVLDFAKGGEMYKGMGTDRFVPLMADELCYFDSSTPTPIVTVRDFNYQYSEITKITPDTKNIVVNIDGNDGCTLADVEKMMSELIELLQKHCGGTPDSTPVFLDARP
ncbi:lysine--tRNA ligase [Candidatus Gracilibacteria bacterium]|nr:lysine--tRNA ligase [Candidatus Gracilibacteria bacterium]